MRSVALGSLLVLLLTVFIDSLQKVVVPAHFHEYDDIFPDWITDQTIRQQYNYSVFLYQRENSSAPNYIGYNRAGENAVFYKYIVDHYHNFPDVAIFVHAKPHEHQQHFLNYIGCISPNASFSSINDYFITERSTSYWSSYDLWIEQCWRDVLKIAWNKTSDELSLILPKSQVLSVSVYCCQQFLISREMVHRRSLDDWKQLQLILGQRNVCHVGMPEYNHLFSQPRAPIEGPEPINPPDIHWTHDTTLTYDERQSLPGTGRIIQGTTSEHLSHVIFGHLPLHMKPFTQEDYCNNFLSSSMCPHSPCVDYRTTYPDNILIKCESKPHVYHYDHGTKRLFPNVNVFISYNYDFADVKTIPCSVIDVIPEGAPMTSKSPNSRALRGAYSYIQKLFKM